MIPFVLGIITGFLLAVLLMVIYAVAISSGDMSRREEGWDQKDDVHGYAEPTSTEGTNT